MNIVWKTRAEIAELYGEPNMKDSKFKWYEHWIGMAQYISRKS